MCEIHDNKTWYEILKETFPVNLYVTNAQIKWAMMCSNDVVMFNGFILLSTHSNVGTSIFPKWALYHWTYRTVMNINLIFTISESPFQSFVECKPYIRMLSYPESPEIWLLVWSFP